MNPSPSVNPSAQAQVQTQAQTQAPMSMSLTSYIPDKIYIALFFMFVAIFGVVLFSIREFKELRAATNYLAGEYKTLADLLVSSNASNTSKFNQLASVIMPKPKKPPVVAQKPTSVESDDSESDLE